MLGGRRHDSGVTFEIPVEGGIDGDAVLAKVKIAGVAVLGTDAPGGRWAPDSVRLFDREHLTIRPVEVRVSAHVIEVTIFMGSSAADAELGVAFAHAVGTIANSTVRDPVLGERLLPDDFRARHGAQWCKDLERETYQALLTWATASKVELPTLRGPLAAGPTLVAYLKRGPEPAIALRDAFRRLMWIDREDVHVGVTSITDVGSNEVRVGSWARGVPTLLDVGSAHAIALEDAETSVYVPKDALIDALDNDAVWLSEDHVLVPGLDDTGWGLLHERVRKHAVADVNTLAGPRQDPGRPDRALLEDWTPEAVATLDRLTLTALRRGVVIAMLIVARADGIVEERERAALIAWLDGAAARKGPFAILFPKGAADGLPLLESATKSNIPVGALFVTTLSALKSNVGRRGRRAYAEELRGLALSVAEITAETGWASMASAPLSFLRPRVKAAEQAALDTLDAMLAKITAV